jgi:uncharacterized repeat protein (TIGR03803 family)
MFRKDFPTRILTAAIFFLLAGTGVWATETETVLYSFGLNGLGGASPRMALIQDPAGNFYGTTPEGPLTGLSCGVVFELSPASGGGWTYTTLYTFTGASDGCSPYSALLRDAAGNLYGTTFWFGSVNSNCPVGCGTVFELSPGSGGSWTFQTIYSFQGGGDGWAPQAAALVFDSAGNLYGTTTQGGPGGFGTVFRLNRGSRGTWTESLLYGFKGKNDGAGPRGMVFDRAGNLYGVTSGQGAFFGGTAFELSPRIQGTGWTFKLLHTFAGAASGDGYTPDGTPILDKGGNLYGTTFYGGPPACFAGLGCGTVFVLRRTSKGWSEHILHSFSNGTDGFGPVAGLAVDGTGNLYGTTTDASGPGTVFELSYGSGGWVFTTIYSFFGGNDGTLPTAGLTVGIDGNLYGMTASSGLYGWGVVYELSTN